MKWSVVYDKAGDAYDEEWLRIKAAGPRLTEHGAMTRADRELLTDLLAIGVGESRVFHDGVQIRDSEFREFVHRAETGRAPTFREAFLHAAADEDDGSAYRLVCDHPRRAREELEPEDLAILLQAPDPSVREMAIALLGEIREANRPVPILLECEPIGDTCYRPDDAPSRFVFFLTPRNARRIQALRQHLGERWGKGRFATPPEVSVEGVPVVEVWEKAHGWDGLSWRGVQLNCSESERGFYLNVSDYDDDTYTEYQSETVSNETVDAIARGENPMPPLLDQAIREAPEYAVRVIEGSMSLPCSADRDAEPRTVPRQDIMAALSPEVLTPLLQHESRSVRQRVMLLVGQLRKEAATPAPERARKV